MSTPAHSPVRIIIFAKAPLAGFAKTRLIPALGASGAAALAREMLLHTVHAALESRVGSVELCATPAVTEVAAWSALGLPADIIISEQGDGELGERLARAAQRSIERGECAILIGTDCVEMSPQLLHDARDVLFNHDALLHCTADGGYALLGLNRFSTTLFNDIPWSTNAVATTTLARLAQLGWSVHVGQMLHDVDEPQDLKYLNLEWSDRIVA
ncbi:TIGR04282 family arsenosugar biosynthesis glycosyltransferase [Ferrigenium sp. UT5]|uniref:TIGR04282 family arsenosugar biosynthesis glycosyltransferase n=1 Tax=Ferrigenium sp. UT5 TaxID=3242105 RepID=UPI0035501722